MLLLLVYQLPLRLFLFQVISQVGDLMGLKYFPAEPTKQQQEKLQKLD